MIKKLYIGLFCLLILGLAGCTKTIKDTLANVNAQGEHAEGNQVKSLTATGLTKLDIQNGVGDIKITVGKDDNITVKADVKVQGADTEEQAKEILELIVLIQEKDKETASYYAAAKGSESINLEKWLKDTYGSKLNLIITITATIPESIASFHVIEGVGNISIDDSNISGVITSGVGDIVLKGVAFVEKTDITSGTGSIKVIARKVDQAKSVHAVAGVGDITLSIPEKASYSVDISAFMKDDVKQDYNGGGPLFTLKTGVGSVKQIKNELK
ncbi:MAG: hypothetical protein H7X86_05295 [Gorillibacterium sp.]|nr:hypothetical protein [Gorillibacterium sp.]